MRFQDGSHLHSIAVAAWSTSTTPAVYMTRRTNTLDRLQLAPLCVARKQMTGFVTFLINLSNAIVSWARSSGMGESLYLTVCLTLQIDCSTVAHLYRRRRLSPWGSQYFLLLWNPEAHCRVHKTSPLYPILSMLCTAHTVIPSLFDVRFNIIPPSTSRF
jgi:hypothetical protein